jgi:hypothetical protein
MASTLCQSCFSADDRNTAGFDSDDETEIMIEDDPGRDRVGGGEAGFLSLSIRLSHSNMEKASVYDDKPVCRRFIIRLLRWTD